MAKQKLTRKSYKRNIVVFGLMLFMGIALVSTGFATWVLSQDTSTTASGNVEVGVISDNELKIENLKYYTVYTEDEKVEVTESNLEFNFEPTAEDTSGRVKNDGSNFEQMNLYIVGEISPTDFIDDFTVQVTLPAGVEKAIEEGYIALDANTAKYATKDAGGTTVIGANVIEGGTVVAGFEVITSPEEGVFQFVVHVGFVWGTKFNAKNPGIYYDEDETGKTVAYADVKAALQNLRSAVHGCSYVTFDDVDYEIFEIQGQTYAHVDGAYYKATITKDGSTVTNVELGTTAQDVNPETPKFEIKITVTAK